MSVSAASLVLLIGLFYFGAQVTHAYVGAQAQVRDGMDDARDRASVAKQAALSIDSVAYDAGQQRVTLTATNTGSVTFDGSRLDVVIQGVVRTSDVSSRQVGSVTTDVWAPRQEIVILVENVASSPTDVVLVSDTGALDFWRS